jgi:hypothetical protein
MFIGGEENHSDTNKLRTILMTFIDRLIAEGYVFDDENYDGCYVRTDGDNMTHVYQIGEDDGEWNYVTMNEDFDVLFEVTFDSQSDTIYSLIP